MGKQRELWHSGRLRRVVATLTTHHALAIAGYVVLTFVTTWPWALSFTSSIPGDGVDGSLFLWNEWWVQKAIFTPGLHVFQTDHMFYPKGVSLVFHTLTLLNGLLAIPLRPALGPVVAHNLLILLSFALSGYGTYLLSLHVGSSRVAAFLGGVVYTFCPWKFGHLLGHVNLTSTQWMPLYVLFLARAFEAKTTRTAAREAAAAGAFFACNVYSEYNFAFFVTILTVVYLGWRVITVGRDAVRVPSLVAAGTLLAAALVALAPIAWMIATSRQHVAVPTQSGADTFVADLAAYVVPSPLHPLFGARAVRSIPALAGPADSTVFLGYSVMALAGAGLVVGVRAGRPVGFFAVLAALFLVLSLGPHLHLWGHQTDWTLPFAYVDRIPIIRNARAPSRFAVVVALAVAVLASAGATEVLRRAATRWAQRGFVVAAAVTVGAILFEYWAAPFPTERLSRPAAYAAMARDPDAGSLLQVPLGWRDGFHNWGREEPEFLFHQTLHHKRLIGGLVSRLPEGRIDEYFAAPVLATTLRLQEEGSLPFAGDLARERRLADELVRTYDVGWVVVRPPHIGGNAHKYLVDVMPLEPFRADADAVVYRVVQRR